MNITKYHILQSDYDKEKGYSFVKIKTKIGDFTGSSQFNKDEDDPNYQSMLLGGAIAEGRAFINYLKKAITITKIQIKTANDIRSHFVQSGISGRPLQKLDINIRTLKDELFILETVKKDSLKTIQTAIDDHIKRRKKVLSWNETKEKREQKKKEMIQKLIDLEKEKNKDKKN